MPNTLRMRSLLVVLVLCLLLGVPLFAQVETATLSGVVQDPNGRVVPDVEVTATRIETGTAVMTKTNSAGIYFFTGLMPGHYHLVVQKPGFKEIAIKEFQLYVQDKLEQNFSLEIGSVSETVTVEGGGLMINTTDASVSTVVDQTFVKNMPLNGRSFQNLILLTPGVVTNNPSPRTVAGNGIAGEFSVNGQRTESNYYTVDGVSANIGISSQGANVPGGTSGSLPASTAQGTTQGLVSVDELQEFRVQSSTYSSEYGRNPGGQFSFVTRSGTNQLHGTVFEYFRNDVLDANNWFNNSLGRPKSPLRQNDFGGTLGGPVRIPHVYDGKDKTFFFFSYEGLRLLQPQAATVVSVPDANLRATTPSPLQQVLNAFPLPNGPNMGNGLAQFIGIWSNPSHLNSTSIRLDHAMSDKLRIFFRFNDTPSSAGARSTGNPASTNLTAYTTRTYTLGATSSLSNRLSNEFRLNYSSNKGELSNVLDNFGGAQAVSLFQLAGLNAGSTLTPFIQVGLNFSGSTPAAVSQFSNKGYQKQWNAVDTLGLSLGRHQFKFGIDFRRLAPSIYQASPNVLYFYFSARAVQTNSVGFGSAQSNAPAVPLYTNFSAFAQDEWRLTSRLNLSMGLRWEVNPSPGSAKGKSNLPYTVTGNGLSNLVLAPQGTPLWNTSWYNFGPRLGVAYVLRKTLGWETVLRGGGGVFFATGQQLGSYGYAGVGFSATNSFGSLFGVPASFPLTATQANPPIVNPPVPQYGNVFAFPAHLQLPYTLQWNASIEQALGKSQTFTVTYVGANGRRLLEQTQVNAGSFNPNFSTIFFSTNGLTSAYDALQMQFQRRLSHGLQALAAYTWSHSIDFGSLNASLPYIRGNSDFDIRHSFSGALSFDLPNASQNHFARLLLHHWGIDNRFTARSGFPLTLNGRTTSNPATGQVFFGGLNLLPGVPIYLFGPQFPGGRRVNPAAFSLPPVGQQGNAARNFVRGFGAWQMDVALRREFPIHERLKLQFRAEAFNIFNHPNFGTINATYCPGGVGCTFGQATATLSQSLGGLSPLYQSGGPRSMQFALKLIF